MPYRKILHVRDQIYHVYNRGIARMPIFSSTGDFNRFLDLISYYQFANTPISFSSFKKLALEKKENILKFLHQERNLHVELLSFCLMNNHFHFLLKQIGERGIVPFVSNIQNGYAKYYNLRHDRVGPLFQPMFKSVRIETDEQLLHVSRYIHLNPSTGYIIAIADLERYHWSSLKCYINSGSEQYDFVNIEIIMSLIKTKKKYKEFVFDQAEYQRMLGDIKHLILEE